MLHARSSTEAATRVRGSTGESLLLGLDPLHLNLLEGTLVIEKGRQSAIKHLFGELRVLVLLEIGLSKQ